MSQAWLNPEFPGMLSTLLLLALLSSAWLPCQAHSGGGRVSSSSSKAPPHVPTAPPPQEGQLLFPTCSRNFPGLRLIGQTWVHCSGPQSHPHLGSRGRCCSSRGNHGGSESGRALPQRERKRRWAGEKAHFNVK